MTGDLPSYENIILELLDGALKSGIKESEFWDMTIAEIERQAEANNWRLEQDRKERAELVYMAPQLIGLQIARIFAKNPPEYPQIYDVFPHLFEEEIVEETKQQQRVNASYANFMKFAQHYNKIKKEVKNSND